MNRLGPLKRSVSEALWRIQFEMFDAEFGKINPQMTQKDTNDTKGIYIYILYIYIYLRLPMYVKKLLSQKKNVFLGKSWIFWLRAFFGFPAFSWILPIFPNLTLLKNHESGLPRSSGSYDGHDDGSACFEHIQHVRSTIMNLIWNEYLKQHLIDLIFLWCPIMIWNE